MVVFSIFPAKIIEPVIMKKSNNKEVEALEKRIKDLERAVGRNRGNADHLERMIALAKTERDITARKV